jgi:pyruvate dehydrogenase E1 component beta subunit
MREITYFEAVFEAEREEMARDERVILIGEDLALYEKTGLLPGVGPNRIRSAPISENSFVGMAVGAALTGLRPIVDLTIASFCFVAADQLVSQAAKSRYMFGGQADVPLVVRSAMWHDGSNAAHHSDRPYPMFMNVPGLKIAVPATPRDAKGLLKAAVRDDDPVLLFEDKNLWFQRGPVPDGDAVVPLGVADVKRSGGDATVVAIGGTVAPALAAAEELLAEGCSVEVIDPRTLVPLDTRAILESVARTGRLVVVDLANKTCGAAAEIAAIAAEEAFDSLRAPIVRVTTPDVPIPFSPPLEKPLYPDREKILAAVRRVLA